MIWLLLLQLSQPHPVRTPGVIRPLSTTQVCTIRWGRDRRHVTEGMKRRVAAAYGLAWADRGTVEFDHLIPRELGGADDERNLWPQAWAEARPKDRIENALHRSVCAGTIRLKAAQSQMRRWGQPSGPASAGAHRSTTRRRP